MPLAVSHTHTHGSSIVVVTSFCTMVEKKEMVAPGEDEDVRVPTPLYRRMTVVMHVIIFLYAAAFWIQTGVLPVSYHYIQMYTATNII